MINKLNIYGFASGIAANDPNCGLGPLYMYYHPELWQILPFEVIWQDLLMAASPDHGLKVLDELVEVSTLLAEGVAESITDKTPFCVLGGDHSCGIGTWSGAAHALRDQGPLGLIWVDAHMDSHTPETSPTENLHGMPVSHLMGHGVQSLCQLLDDQPKLKPEHICFIGIRSYEPGEAGLLEDLKVKVYFMEEVRERGIAAVFAEALAYIQSKVAHFGLTIDLDAFDPLDAPGVGCREAGGIRVEEFLPVVEHLHQQPGFVGLEIAEYNPIMDEQAKTARLIPALIGAVYRE
jgi:arginase